MECLHRRRNKIALSFIIAVLVFSAFLAISTVKNPPSEVGEKPLTIDKASLEFRKAFGAVKEVEISGVQNDQLVKLVERLNLVLWMIDRSERLSRQGDPGGAASQAELSIEVSRSIVLDAVKMRRDAVNGIDSERARAAAIGGSAPLLTAIALYLGHRMLRERAIETGKEVKQL